MRGPRTLVGRMALLQLVTMAAALASVVALSFVAIHRLVGRERDRALMSTAGAIVSAVSDLVDALDERHVRAEIDQHRPAGVRVEVVDEAGFSLTAIGEGPRLHPSGDDECADQGGWRVCERSVGELRILVGRSRDDVESAKNRFLLVVVAASVMVVGVGALLSRTVAGRGLLPLSHVSKRLMAVTPGQGDRLNIASGLTEIDEFSNRIDQLLARVDVAVSRERRFSAQASHELKTPLTVLRGELEELVARSPHDTVSVQRALESAEELVELVDSLLLLCRAETQFQTADLELLNLADIVRDEIERTAKTSKLNGYFVTDLPDELLVLGNEQLLARAISNILDNAAKYGVAGSPAEISAGTRDGIAFLAVRDHGAGVPEQYRERIFEPFFRDPRLRSLRPGHGLGLTLARAVAHAHAGDLHFTPGTKDGSVFELQIPVSSRRLAAG